MDIFKPAWASGTMGDYDNPYYLAGQIIAVNFNHAYLDTRGTSF